MKSNTATTTSVGHGLKKGSSSDKMNAMEIAEHFIKI